MNPDSFETNLKLRIRDKYENCKLLVNVSRVNSVCDPGDMITATFAIVGVGDDVKIFYFIFWISDLRKLHGH